MQNKLNFMVVALILVFGAAHFCVPAIAQDAQSAPLAEQLKAQYKMVVASGDANGYRIVEAGTVLVIQKDGIIGFPPGDETVVPVKYQDGKLHRPNGFLMALKVNRQPFNVGNKVYPLGIDVDLKKDSVTMGVLACDTLFKTSVVFQFAKGSLPKMGVPEVMDTISQVFTFDQPAETAQEPQPQAQTDQPQEVTTQPQSIQQGQTVDEVINALGQPQKKIDLGSKQIFIYKDLKVTFKDGKVADAE